MKTLIEKLRALPEYEPRAYYSRVLPEINGTQRSASICCPFHADKTPSFNVNLDPSSRYYGRWKCWSLCGEGDVFDYEAKLQGMTADDKNFWKSLAKRHGIEGDQKQKPATAPAKKKKGRPREFGLESFAAQKGLTVEALKAIHATEKQLGNQTVICFPMFDVAGKMKGWRKRFLKGPPKTNPGGKLGLLVPKGFDKRAGRFYVTEGETDLAAAMMLGLNALGIPGTAQCLKMVVRVAKALKAEIVVVGDNDAPDKRTGRRPGQDGAKRLVQLLNGAKVPVRLWMADKEGTDLRDWVVAGGTREQFLKIIEKLPKAKVEEYVPESVTANAEDREPMPSELARDFLNVTKRGVKDEEEGHADLAEFIRVRYWRGEFFEFHGHRGWQPEDIEDVRAEVWRFSEEFLIRGGPTKPKISNVIEGMQAEVNIRSNLDMPIWLRADRPHTGVAPEPGRYIAVANGLLDTREGRLLDSSPFFFNRNILPVDYAPEAVCPKWQEFLQEIMLGDAERVDIIQEFFGYNLVPDNRYQRFLMMQGEGSNGKSQVMDVAKLLLGRDNVSAVALEQFGDRFGLTPTIGKLLNICGDVPELDRAAEGFIKAFVSGDLITIDRKGISPVNLVPTTKLWLSCNTLPRFHDRSEGIWRRLLLVPFEFVVTEEKKVVNLGQKLFEAESSGILNWCLQGMRRLMENGKFTVARASREAQQEYQMESNPARTYLKEFIAEDLKGHVIRSKLYGTYADWCEHHGFRALNVAHFGRELGKVFPKAERKLVFDAELGKRANSYQGINYIDLLSDEALKDRPAEEENEDLI